MPINEALATCGITTAQGRHAFNFDRFHTVADFARINDDDITNMVKAMGTREVHPYVLGALQVKNIRALVYWARDLRRRQVDIPDNGFTPAVLEDMLDLMEANEGAEEVAVKRPPVLKPDDWDNWEPTFVNYLASLMGVKQVPLDYIVREDGTGPDDFEANDTRNRLIYGVPLNGHAFQHDNRRVANELIALVGTEALPWVEPHRGDGRRMFRALQDHFNGPGEVSKRYNKAKDELKSIHYGNELVFPFASYVGRLKRIFRTYEQAGRPYTEAQKVETMLDNTRPKELDSAKETVFHNYRNDFEAAANYLSERVSSHFAHAVRRREQRRGTQSARSTRYVSSATTRGSNRGRGFGRGNNRAGRGGGRGRGGRGQGGRGNYSNSFNGVDITDVTRSFTADEMEKLGPVGRRLVYDLRKNREQGHTGRGRNERTVSLVHRIEQLEASLAGDTVSEVTTPAAQGANGDTTGNGSVAGSAGRGFGRGRYGRGRS